MAFERDLGYLDKFFDNLDAHAATLGGEGGARLKQLVGEERARWGEIKSLLGAPSPGGSNAGGKGAKAKSDDAQPAKGPPAASMSPSAAAAVTQGAPSGAQTDVTSAATRSPVGGFTVGSLRGR